jgi:hypothetical protein
MLSRIILCEKTDFGCKCTILQVKDGEKCLTQKEIYGFGIPASGSSDWKRTTEVQPFSFDVRDQLLLKKREETVKKVRFNYL